MKILLILASCLIFTACSSTPRFQVDPEWLITPPHYTVLFTEPFVNNPKDVADDLPEYTDKFSEWFSKELAKEITKISKTDHPFQKVDDSTLIIMPAPLDKEKIISIPLPDTTMKIHGIAVVIHPIKVWRDKSSKSSNFLVFTAHYTIVDTDKRKLLAYGTLSAVKQFHFVMTKSDWEECVQIFAEKLLEGTPLIK